MTDRISIGRLAIAALAFVFVTGCKEGEGERCQVDDDCASGLICNQAQQLCTAPGGTTGIDATVPDAPIDGPPVPIDAPPIDAPPIDAPPTP